MNLAQTFSPEYAWDRKPVLAALALKTGEMALRVPETLPEKGPGAPRPDRMGQVEELLRQRPGLTRPEILEALDLPGASAGSLILRMWKDNRIVRKGASGNYRYSVPT